MRRYISAREDCGGVWDGVVPDVCTGSGGDYREDCGGMFRWAELDVWSP